MALIQDLTEDQAERFALNKAAHWKKIAKRLAARRGADRETVNKIKIDAAKDESIDDFLAKDI